MPTLSPRHAVACLLLMAAGCASTSLQRAESVEHSLNAAMIAANAAMDAGLVKTPAQARAIRIAIDEANTAVADYSARAIDGTADADYHTRRAIEAVARLTALVVSLKEQP